MNTMLWKLARDHWTFIYRKVDEKFVCNIYVGHFAN